MGFVCSVSNCTYNSKNMIMRSFPKDPILLAKWLESIDREDLLEKGIERIRTGYRVCDIHFRDEDRFIANRNRSNLKHYVVPTLHLNRTESTSNLTEIENISPTLPDIDCSPINNIEEITISDSMEIDTRCRVCLASNHGGIPLSTVTSIDGEPKSLFEILNICSVIKIYNGDGRPQTICVDCVERAKAAYEFNITFRKSDLKLRFEEENLESSSDSSMEKVTITKTKERNIGEDERIPIFTAPTVTTTTKISSIKNEERCYTTTTSTNKNKERSYTTNTSTNKKSSIKNKERGYNRTICVQCRKHFHKHSRHKLFTHVCIGVKRYFCTTCGARYALFKNFYLHQQFHVKAAQNKLFSLWDRDDIDSANLLV